MGILDSPLRAVSKTVIGKFGTAVTLRVISYGDYDPETGKIASKTNSDTTTTGVRDEYSVHEIDNDTIKVGDLRVIVPASDFATAPDPDGWAIIGSDTYRVVSVRPIIATDQAAAYSLQLRTG